MHYVQQQLDRTTMYRVVLYGLSVISFAALTLAVAQVLAIAPLALLASFAAITLAATVAHYACTTLFQAPGNIESSLITSLILFLILTPDASVAGLSSLALMGAGAIVLKYIVRYRLRHVFNPVALVLVLAALFGYYGAEWWVGSRYLLPVVAVTGLLVVMKTRRWPLVLTYLVVSSLAVVVVFLPFAAWNETLLRHFISWPTIFFAAFMLTEPLSLPGTKRMQYAYAALVALLASVPFTVGPLYGTPELALLVGNLLTFVVDKPARFRLSLVKKEVVGKGTYEYTFASDQAVPFVPGQYLEWTLPHLKPDLRGIRRYFTIASAPGSPMLSFAVRHSEPGSSWKRALASLAPGALLYATQRAGDFTLRPNDGHRVFIAGGIGVTPFVSMVRTARSRGEQLNATLFYCNKTEADIAYDELLALGAAVGLRVVHVLEVPAVSGRANEVGFITHDMLNRYEPALLDATYYISGPPGLVRAYTTMLTKAGVPGRRIVTDYFPGLA